MISIFRILSVIVRKTFSSWTVKTENYFKVGTFLAVKINSWFFLIYWKSDSRRYESVFFFFSQRFLPNTTLGPLEWSSLFGFGCYEHPLCSKPALSTNARVPSTDLSFNFFFQRWFVYRYRYFPDAFADHQVHAEKNKRAVKTRWYGLVVESVDQWIGRFSDRVTPKSITSENGRV